MSQNLPGAEFWSLVRPHTGGLVEVRRTARGFRSDLTALVACERGPFFVKGVRNLPGGRRDSLVRERLINPAVRTVSPALRWHAEDERWIVLGFEVVEGRVSDLAPGSPDLPAVVAAVDRIGALPLPEVARGWAETRWDRFTATGSDTVLLRGGALLHTDINSGNVLVGERGTWVVDWSWPTYGAVFIDLACLVLQLVAAGHGAEEAESWASGCTAWAEAEPKAVDAFAVATARMYWHAADRKSDAVWLTEMADAAQRWAVHRGVA